LYPEVNEVSARGMKKLMMQEILSKLGVISLITTSFPDNTAILVELSGNLVYL
jgi:hypothetical protein